MKPNWVSRSLARRQTNRPVPPSSSPSFQASNSRYSDDDAFSVRPRVTRYRIEWTARAELTRKYIQRALGICENGDGDGESVSDRPVGLIGAPQRASRRVAFASRCNRTRRRNCIAGKQRGAKWFDRTIEYVRLLFARLKKRICYFVLEKGSCGVSNERAKSKVKHINVSDWIKIITNKEYSRYFIR